MNKDIDGFEKENIELKKNIKKLVIMQVIF